MFCIMMLKHNHLTVIKFYEKTDSLEKYMNVTFRIIDFQIALFQHNEESCLDNH